MRTVELIRKKRDGKSLNTDEIRHLIEGYCAGTIPDVQMAAFASAVYFRGMTSRETLDLTKAMASSGERVDLSPIGRPVADKHSTGGVGDTTTLVAAPLVAAAGVPVAKMSGGALGHTGGTIDKLSCIPRLHTDLPAAQLVAAVRKTNIAIAAQTEDLVPADEKLYRLRHATATVESLPLIASSIMSKKLAGGADVLVLDVKTGGGALLPERPQAVQLGQLMVDIAAGAGVRTAAVLSDMSQPLGRAVGNSLEVREAIATLSGEGPADLEELSLVLGGHMLALAGAAPNASAGRGRLARLLADGYGLQKFARFVDNQGGDPAIVEDPSLLPAAAHRIRVASPKTGYITAVDARTIGEIASTLARCADGTTDLAAGVVVKGKAGERVQQGQPLVWLHTGDPQPADLEQIIDRVGQAFVIEKSPVGAPPLIHEVLHSDDDADHGS